MAYFRCGQGAGGNELKILITTTDTSLYGQTITISKDGSTVGTTTFDNTGNAEYTVDEAGLYTVSCGGASESVLVEDEYEVSLSAIPDGSTVTPVNDIQTWLNCAGIFNKTTYTTISDVLADTTTLLALINSQNAVDYMVRSHAWCDDVCADATAMTYIGANNYAADTLLADDNPNLVPTMTSDTTPSGECLYSDEYYSRYAYYAFDNNWNKTINTAAAITAFNGWASGSDRNVYLGYDFGQAVLISQVAFRSGGYASGPYLIDTYKIQYSDDNSVWTDATNELTAAKTYDKQVVTLPSASSHRYWRLFVVFNGTATYSTLVSNLQFYAKDGSWLESICNSAYFESVLDVKVPTMTSLTTPSGEIIYSSYYTQYPDTHPLYAFDGTTGGSNRWMTNGAPPQFIGYKFTSAVRVHFVTVLTADIGGPKTSKVQGSNDNSTWTDIDDFANCPAARSSYSKAVSNSTAYLYYRLYITANNGNYTGSIDSLQFYGRSAS